MSRNVELRNRKFCFLKVNELQVLRVLITIEEAFFFFLESTKSYYLFLLRTVDRDVNEKMRANIEALRFISRRLPSQKGCFEVMAIG